MPLFKSCAASLCWQIIIQSIFLRQIRSRILPVLQFEADLIPNQIALLFSEIFIFYVCSLLFPLHTNPLISPVHFYRKQYVLSKYSVQSKLALRLHKIHAQFSVFVKILVDFQTKRLKTKAQYFAVK